MQGDSRIPAGHVGFSVLLMLPDGQSWVGGGRSKKGAQHHAAALCLRETKNIDVSLPDGAGLHQDLKTCPPQVKEEKHKSESTSITNTDIDCLKMMHELHPGLVETYKE